jgi:hypothetical protein
MIEVSQRYLRCHRQSVKCGEQPFSGKATSGLCMGPGEAGLVSCSKPTAQYHHEELQHALLILY